MEMYTFSFLSTARAYRISADVLNPVIDSLIVDAPEKRRLKLIVSELVMNAYVHGNKGDPDKTIDVVIQIDDKQFVVMVKDQGKGLTEEKYHQAVMSASGESDESGRGMKIVHKLSDQVQLYKDKDDKFCIRVTRRINSSPTDIKSDTGRDSSLEATMNITQKVDGDVNILGLQGRLDLTSASELKDASRDIIDKENCKLVLNMEAVDFINSSGLGALVSILKDVRSSKGTLKLSNLAPYIKEIFEITQLSNIFDICENDQIAKSSF